MTDQELAVIRQRFERLEAAAVWGVELPQGFWEDLTVFIREDAPRLLKIAEAAPYP